MAAMAAILDIGTEQFYSNLNLYVAPCLLVCGEMSFEELQENPHGGHLGYWNGTILAILNLCVTVMPPINFQLNHGLTVWEEMLFEDFKMATMAAILAIDRTILG